MSKLFKYLIFLLVGLTAFALVLAVVLFTVINPNRYKPALEAAASQQTGMQLRINGDIDWTFRPVFGLSIADVSLRNGVTPQELASFSSIALKLDIGSLLSGNLAVQEFVAEDLYINWFVDAQGQANWLVNTAEAAPVTAPATGSNELPIDINIADIRVINASVAIRDLSSNIDTRLQNIDLRSQNTNLENRPFPFELSMRLINETGGQDLTLDLASTAQVDFNAGNIDLNDMRFTLSPLVLSGDVSVTDFRNNMRWQTNLSSNTFNLSHLLANFMVVDEDSMPAPNQQQFTIQTLEANGDAAGATLGGLTVALDGTTAELRGDYLFATDTRQALLAYNLNTGAIDLDSLLPASLEEPASASADATASGQNTAQSAVATDNNDSPLPLDLLRSMDVRGEHTIASLTASGLQFSPVQFGLLLQNGVLNIDTQPIGFYDGELDATVTLNATSSPAQLAIETALTGISASALTDDLPRLDFFTGNFNASTTHMMQGDTVNALLDSIDGASTLQVNDSSVDITLLKRVFSAISVLSPSGNIAAQWPDVVRFSNAEAYLLFNDGFTENQELNLQLDNFNVSGTGGLDLAAGEFDYRVDFTVLGEPALQTLRVNEDFQNVAWPVRCEAAFTDTALQYCSPDLQRVREVFAAIARDEIQQRASEAVGEQVERLRNRIQNLLQN
ncbi:AsmA family protein [Pseudohongiella sp.]|uniref:AsmA domain-containing protein n=1 Tax=marine sediment metagenome TaxID=412755 RepID=A0A0F9W742_9ZZZZ|nr:AsmA family protein [Pseudohongiella sp.]HDZ09320.1 AsmA family protein [Pseudohongiella sp.]HEA63831.1 AsmA family protein [Pseudohongiella sp.]